MGGKLSTERAIVTVHVEGVIGGKPSTERVVWTVHAPPSSPLTLHPQAVHP